MPSTLRALLTVAGCAAVTATTLVVGAGPSAASPTPTVGLLNPTHGKVGSSLTIDETGFTSGHKVDVTIGAGSTTGKVSTTASTITVKVPAGATTAPVTVTDAADHSVKASSAPEKFTVDPTVVPPKHTKLVLAVSRTSLTYPGKVSVTATLTSAGDAVKGLAVRLQHSTRGSQTWQQAGGTGTVHTSHTGLAHWSVAPRSRGTYRAVFAGTKAFAASVSRSHAVAVRPTLHLSMPSSTDVLLKSVATGRLTPSLTGVVKLERRSHHHWHVVATPHVHHGLFKAGIRMTVPGTETFRVVRATDVRHLSATSRVVSTRVVAPTLRIGATGAVVKALQQRLHKLHYDVGSRDGSYGWDAEHAVTAFEKVQGMSKDGVAGPGVFSALADPQHIHLKHKIKSGIAVEVNIKKQVLLISKNGKVWRILDTSTAGGYLYTGSNGQTERAVTPRGHFHVVYKVDSLVHARLGTLFKPSFFNYDGYAIHGEGNGNSGNDVPPYPNSHGCVRITDNAVNRYYSKLPVGTSVWIYG